MGPLSVVRVRGVKGAGWFLGSWMGYMECGGLLQKEWPCRGGEKAMRGQEAEGHTEGRTERNRRAERKAEEAVQQGRLRRCAQRVRKRIWTVRRSGDNTLYIGWFWALKIIICLVSSTMPKDSFTVSFPFSFTLLQAINFWAHFQKRGYIRPAPFLSSLMFAFTYRIEATGVLHGLIPASHFSSVAHYLGISLQLYHI